MRPVNLIPPEERRGDRAPTRTGPMSYLIVGALALALGAVTLIVLTNNQIADRNDEISSLEAQQAAAAEKATALAPYAEFASMAELRATTVDSLARSRFDWERVLRELALVIPEGIQMTNVTGSVAPGLQLEGASTSTLRDGATGPALEVSGCAASNKDVAELAASLEDIDGVTRVGVNRSQNLAENAATAGAGGAAAGGGCETDSAVYQFEMLAAFDEVTVTAAAPEEPEATPASAETPAPGGTDGEAIADAQAQEDQARESTQDQADKVHDAAGLIPGVAR